MTSQLLIDVVFYGFCLCQTCAEHFTRGTFCQWFCWLHLELQVKRSYRLLTFSNTNCYVFQKELPDEAIHLLFSANRWEKANSLLKMLEHGTTVVVDRYCFSGVAFSAAKGDNSIFFVAAVRTWNFI